jgi:hypothetical protein
MNNISFDEHIAPFHSKLTDLKKARKYPVKSFFNENQGYKYGLKNLINNKEDFQGIYVFWEGDQAVYTGISKKVINRLYQQIKGSSHNVSSLPIKLLRSHSEAFATKARKDFTTEDIKKGQGDLMLMEVSFLSIEDSIELYLFEVYVALTLNCKYNDFETH